jgi:hypothetical protein
LFAHTWWCHMEYYSPTIMSSTNKPNKLFLQLWLNNCIQHIIHGPSIATCPLANIQFWLKVDEKDSPSCIVWLQMCHMSSNSIVMGIDLGLGHGTNIVVNWTIDLLSISTLFHSMCQQCVLNWSIFKVWVCWTILTTTTKGM